MGEKLDAGWTPPPPLTLGTAGDQVDQAEYQRMLATPLPQGMEQAQWSGGTWHGYNKQTQQPMTWNTATHAWEVSK
jgi:hypothetical protein